MQTINRHFVFHKWHNCSSMCYQGVTNREITPVSREATTSTLSSLAVPLWSIACIVRTERMASRSIPSDDLSQEGKCSIWGEGGNGRWHGNPNQTRFLHTKCVTHRYPYQRGLPRMKQLDWLPGVNKSDLHYSGGLDLLRYAEHTRHARHDALEGCQTRASRTESCRSGLRSTRARTVVCRDIR